MLADQIENTIRSQIPKQEVADIVDNIGLPYSQLNFMYNTSGVIGASDADVLVTLSAKHHPTPDYVRTLRTMLPRQFPEHNVLFPAGRHGHANPELWIACAGGCPDRRSGPGRES